MKLPFSYKQQAFGSLLAVSLVGHSFLFIAGGQLMPKAKYSVEQAPSSVDIFFIRETREPIKKEEPPEEVLTSETAEMEIPLNEKKEQAVEEQSDQSVVSPPHQGAVTKAVPDYQKNPAPVYPRLARQRGWEGVVILKVHVNSSGQAESVQVEQSSGSKVLDQSALRTVRKWHFLPARLGQVRFASTLEIPIRFVLKEEV